jgi:xanthine dehydrogenase accessory factor/xanthine dehydrogenase large subunit
VTEALVAALAAIDQSEPAILVEIVEALGSTPREAGALMLVTADAIAGTIGGGELEHRAILRAREALAGEPLPERLDLPLGPALAQCCGGHVTLRLRQLAPAERPTLAERLAAWHAALPRVVLFGAGHVGEAVVASLAPLPCRVLWLDSRPGQLPADAPGLVETREIADPAGFATAPGDLVLVMTHSHPLDLAIVEAVLRRGSFAWLGLIGSATKRRRFERQLGAVGLSVERLVCPIGLAAITGKAPAVIAASVTAQLLVVMEALTRGRQIRSVA